MALGNLFRNATHPGVARTLVLYILLVSSAVTLIATVYQLYRDYRTDVNLLEDRLNQIEISFAQPLAESLWAFDYQQVEVNLAGISRMPDVYFAQVTAFADGQKVQAGTPSDTQGIERVIPLTYNDGRSQSQVGQLLVSASMEGILSRIREKAILVLVSQAIKTFLVSLFMFLIINQLVIRHLETIADFASQFRPGQWKTLSLDRAKPKKADEFENVTHAFNEMQAELSSAYEDLLQSNAELDQKTKELANHKANLEREVEERTRELRDAQQRLLDSARRSGMAEIAVGTLHHVGNTLNSLNVSCQILMEQQKKSKLESLKKANEILKNHLDDYNPYFEADSKNRKLAEFYLTLGHFLEEEHEQRNQELTRMYDQIRWVRKAVQDQESYANFDSVQEQAQVSVILDQVLELQMSTIQKNGISVIKDFREARPIVIPKAKIHYILAHLVKNAVEAMQDPGIPKRILTLQIEEKSGYLSILIQDSGVGIDPQIKEHLFEYGFTTKPTGQGFGLHMCANTLHEMGGELKVESKGIGKGARFLVMLPLT
ncbi:MAG: GHKL domain-containing protein [Acidobacteria bacterium]|nr:GHKL domain-containing protein [Acidobacteriota bacterium]MCB9397420.1 GHKL domain-containing protein [Acidobacteriota bacterium]